MIIKTASDLKLMYERVNQGYFFTRKTMKFFGDTMSNYYVPVKGGKARIVDVETSNGEIVKCYALERKRAVKHGICKTQYFDCETYDTVIAK